MGELEAAVAEGGAQAGVAMLEKKLRDEPHNMSARFILATAYQATGNHAACIETARTEVSLQKADDRLLGILWVCLYETGEREEAMRTATGAVERFPQSAESHRWLGISLLDDKNQDEARLRFEEALILDPADGTSLYMLAQLYPRANLAVAGVLTYLRFLAVEPVGNRSAKARTQLRALLKPELQLSFHSETSMEASLSVGSTAPGDDADLSTAQRALATYVAPTSQQPDLTVTKLSKGLDAFIAALPGSGKSAKRSFARDRLIPYLVEARQQGHLPGLAELVLLDGDKPTEASLQFLRWSGDFAWPTSEP